MRLILFFFFFSSIFLLTAYVPTYFVNDCFYSWLFDWCSALGPLKSLPLSLLDNESYSRWFDIIIYIMLLWVFIIEGYVYGLHINYAQPFGIFGTIFKWLNIQMMSSSSPWMLHFNVPTTQQHVERNTICGTIWRLGMGDGGGGRYICRFLSRCKIICHKVNQIRLQMIHKTNEWEWRSHCLARAMT